MDDIQFWLYLAFALIYFITRGLKKKPEEKPQRPGQAQSEQSSERRERPVSFEELLREFTEGKQTEEEQPTESKPEKRPEPQFKQVEYQSMADLKREETQQPFEEGKTRRFSDEESRRVYEESIARAEGARLDFQPAEQFKSRLVRLAEKEEEFSTLASEIRQGLSDENEVRKAVIYSEILNRKY